MARKDSGLPENIQRVRPLPRKMSAKLALSAQRAIAAYKRKHPKAPIIEIAEKYNVSPSQVRRAIELDRDGRLTKTEPRTPRKKIREIVKTSTPDDLLKSQYLVVCAGLEADEKIPLSNRASMLEKLVFMRKTMQQIQLQSHMKRTDAGIIALLVRKFEPDADDDRVISLYLEAQKSFVQAPND